MDVALLAEEILARIHAPRFRDATLMITDTGAVADGRADCTAAIRTAIDTLAADGGGRVVVPPGRYRTGPIHLLDGIELHLDDGAVLEFSRDPDDYLPEVFTRYEGIECYGYSPLIYAHGRTDVAVTGTGVLDGRADNRHWWNWTRGVDGRRSIESTSKQLLRDAGATDVPVAERRFGPDAPLRPAFIQFVDCRNVLICDITVRNAPMWVLHPLLCSNVTVSRVTVDSHGPNNDGCDPESCEDVLITGCRFGTGDDCIAIKSGKDADGRRVGRPSRRILITDCDMSAGHGGITVGSETSGGITDVVGRRCRMDSPDLRRALRIKSNPARGGELTRLAFSDITVGRVGDAVIEIALDYENLRSGPFPPRVSQLTFQRITAEQSEQRLRMIGLADQPIRDVSLIDCHLGRSTTADRIEHVVGLHQQCLPKR